MHAEIVRVLLNLDAETAIRSTQTQQHLSCWQFCVRDFCAKFYRCCAWVLLALVHP